MRFSGAKRVLILAALFAGLTLSAKNEVFNGDFKMGTLGFDAERILSEKANPELKYIPLRINAEGQMEIDNPYQEFIQLRSAEFKLKHNTVYTIRIRAKSSLKNHRLRFVMHTIMPSGAWPGYRKTLTLGTEFETFEAEFRTPKAYPDPWMIQLSNEKKDFLPNARITIEKIEIIERGSTEEPLCGAIAEISGFPLYYQRTGETIPVKIHIRNGSKPYDGKLKWNVSAQDTGKLLFSDVQPIRLKPDEIRTVTIQLPSDRFGGFTVTPELDIPGAKSIPANYAVIGKYTPQPIDLDKDFCIALNGGLRRLFIPHSPYIGFDERDLEMKLAAFSALGCRILRDHDAGYEVSSWYILENQRGKWDFSSSDRLLDRYMKHNITLVPCIGRINNFVPDKKDPKMAWRQPGWPEWLLPLCWKQTDTPSYAWPGAKDHVFFPPEELWRGFIRKVAEHYKGKITHYEIFNEPNGRHSPKNYFKHLKSAYEEIKKVDPSSKVIGLCVTGDFGSDATVFVKDVFQLGGGNYMDIASWHPYRNRELASLVPADQAWKSFREMIEGSCGKDFPIWNTELYYVFDARDKRDHVQNRCTASDAVIRLIVDLGENSIQSISLHSDQVFCGSGMMESLRTRMGGKTSLRYAPNAVFAAYNMFARELEGAKIVEKIRHQNGVVIYVLRQRNGKLMAAFWNYERRKGVSGVFGDSKLFDVFGNPLSSGKVPISEELRYAKQGNLSESDFLNLLKNLKTENERPFSIGDSGRIAGNKVSFTFFNHSAKPMQCWFGFLGDGFTAEKAMKKEVPANGYADVFLPIKKSEVVKGSPCIKIHVNGQMWDLPFKGKTVPWLKMGEKIPLKHGSFRFEETADQLRLTVHIEDKSLSSPDPAGRNLWEQDSVELFFDLDPLHYPEYHSWKYQDSTFRLFYLPRAKEGERLTAWIPQRSALTGEDIKLEEDVKPDSYTVSIVLPRKKLGEYLGFDINVNDAVGTDKAKKSFSLTKYKERYKDRSVFAILKLKGEK